jgi:hypothetical protein
MIYDKKRHKKLMILNLRNNIQDKINIKIIKLYLNRGYWWAQMDSSGGLIHQKVSDLLRNNYHQLY